MDCRRWPDETTPKSVPLASGGAPSAAVPGKTYVVVQHVDRAGTAEAMRREALLHLFDHGVDAGLPLALHQGIAIGRGFGPGTGGGSSRRAPSVSFQPSI